MAGAEQLNLPEPSKWRTFSDYMPEFLRRIAARDVVEIGADDQLQIARNLSEHCEKYSIVNFPEDVLRINSFNELGQNMGPLKNVELIEGNAVQLSQFVPHADVIILHNVLLDLTGNDTRLMWEYRRRERECSEKQWDELVSRFHQAEEQGYEEFLKVASPGYVVIFRRPDVDNQFMSFLTEKLSIDPKQIHREELFYDDSDKKWELFIVDNT